MRQIISPVSTYLVLGIFLFLISVFLPAHASMNDGMMEKNTNMTGDEKMMNSEKVMEASHVDPPIRQIKHGVSPHNIKCGNEFTLVLKSTDNSPACVKPSTVNVLVARGWALSTDIMVKMMNQDMVHEMNMVKNETKENKMAMKDNMENKSMGKSMSGNRMSNESPGISKSNADEKQYPDAPSIVGITDYINTTPAKLEQEMKGKVIAYDFWTFNCINCIHTLPHVVDLSNKYLGKDVLVIGIHSPETFVEKDPNNVRDAVHRYNIQYPVVTDNEFQTWNAFGNHYWPHIYIVDAQGKIRYDHIGEGGYEEIDKTIENLLLEKEKQKPKELVMG